MVFKWFERVNIIFEISYLFLSKLCFYNVIYNNNNSKMFYKKNIYMVKFVWFIFVLILKCV